MKSFAFLTISSLGALVASTPDHFQTVPSVLCTDAPAQTVTVTQPCAACQTGAPGVGTGGTITGGTGGDVTVTVTVTDTVTATVTDSSITSTATTTDTTTTTTTSTTTGAGAQQTFHVDVGAFKVDGSNQTAFQFRPSNITNAHVGDLVLFNMLGANHSVTQSQFAHPCIKNGTFDTGFVPNLQNVSDANIRAFTVNVTTPLWFYCRQTGHCGKGMVFGINPKSQDQMQQFIDMAIKQNGTAPSNATTSASGTGSLPSSTGMPLIPGKKASWKRW